MSTQHPRCRDCRKRRPLIHTAAGQLCAQCAPAHVEPERATLAQLHALADRWNGEGRR